MSFNKKSITENIREEIENLIELVSEEKEEASTAYQMEKQLLWKMLALGRQLMQLFFVMRAKREVIEKELEVEGVVYKYRGSRKRSYVSIFGEVEVKRGCYWQRGKDSQYPLDKALSLPKRSFSEWVQEIIGQLSVCAPYEDAVSLMTKWFGLSIPKRSTIQMAKEHAETVASYYEQQARSEPKEHDTILVVSADGKGIPMNRENSPPPKDRRGKGTKKTAKKDATITAIYTVSPFVRRSDDIIATLLPGNLTTPSSSVVRPKPSNKQVFGTLKGKQAAFEQLTQQAVKYQTTQLTDLIALTDGCRSLQLKVEDYLPDFTLILDIIHALEYVWDAANVLFGETNPQRAFWVEDALRSLLEDDHETLFTHLEYQISDPSLSPSKVKTLTKTLNYLRRNRPYMNYQHYLAQGWPIGTGVIEGACRHLVKDRFEQAGMRWSLSGAQAILALRTVHLNSDWDDFQRFRRLLAHQQCYGSTHPFLLPEALILAQAA